MKHINLKTILLLMITIPSVTIKAQEVINSSGGNASSIRGSVSFSVGQIVYSAIAGTKGSVTQGVQQSFIILDLPSNNISKAINLECSVFPNPTTDFLKLKVDENQLLKDIKFQLCHASGKVVLSQQITEMETDIQMNSLSTGLYFLRITMANNYVAVFKIIKK